VTTNYRTTEWNQLPNYECELCPYSTLDLPTMEHHQAVVHAPALTPQAEPREWPSVLAPFGSAPQTGGTVAPSSSPVLVGETGPESFAPTTSQEETK
jgi:hypothetical protein